MEGRAEFRQCISCSWVNEGLEDAIRDARHTAVGKSFQGALLTDRHVVLGLHVPRFGSMQRRADAWQKRHLGGHSRPTFGYILISTCATNAQGIRFWMESDPFRPHLDSENSFWHFIAGGAGHKYLRTSRIRARHSSRENDADVKGKTLRTNMTTQPTLRRRLFGGTPGTSTASRNSGDVTSYMSFGLDSTPGGVIVNGTIFC